MKRDWSIVILTKCQERTIFDQSLGLFKPIQITNSENRICFCELRIKM